MTNDVNNSAETTKVVNNDVETLAVKRTTIAQTSKRAKKILEEKSKSAGKKPVKGETKDKPAEKKADKGQTKNKNEKKPKKERGLSNEKIGEKLYAEKASEQVVLNTFMKVYKDKKGITDKKFIKARANIYMAIAEKRALAKKEAAKKPAKKIEKAA